MIVWIQALELCLTNYLTYVQSVHDLDHAIQKDPHEVRRLRIQAKKKSIHLNSLVAKEDLKDLCLFFIPVMDDQDKVSGRELSRMPMNLISFPS